MTNFNLGNVLFQWSESIAGNTDEVVLLGNLESEPPCNATEVGTVTLPMSDVLHLHSLALPMSDVPGLHSLIKYTIKWCEGEWNGHSE